MLQRAVLIMFVALLVPAAAKAQAAAEGGAFTVNEDLAKKGKSLWTSKGCMGCHTIGKGRSAGPDLAHLTARRDVAWVQKWLMDTTGMLESDPIGKELLAEYKMKMPDFKLKQAEADALINHIAKESSKVKPKEK